MRTALGIFITAIVWCPVILFLGKDSYVFDLFGVKIFPIACLVFGIIGATLPQFFEMGVQQWKDASIARKFLPIIYVGLICYGVTFIVQTVITATIMSLILGNTTTYVSRLIVKG